MYKKIIENGWFKYLQLLRQAEPELKTILKVSVAIDSANDVSNEMGEDLITTKWLKRLEETATNIDRIINWYYVRNFDRHRVKMNKM